MHWKHIYNVGSRKHYQRAKNITGTNLLTKFHEDWTINVASIVKNDPPLVAIGMNLLTRFHEDRTINVVYRVKNAPPLGSHVFQPNVTIFELFQEINKTNLLTIFHEDWTINVASRVLTRKNAPRPGGHAFKEIKTIFELIQDIIGTNLLTKFHEDRIINVASRVFTMFYYSHTWKNTPPPGGHVFQQTGIILELFQDIIRINLLTKFHEDRTINAACRVHISHVFQAKVTIFESIQDIIEKNVLTKFHEDRKINVASRVLTRKNAPPPGGHVPTSIILKLVQDIIGMNPLIKFHEDQTNNVASRVLTRFYYRHIYSHIWKNAPPLGSYVFQAKVTIFELIQDIIGRNHLSN
ncbi:hypothetical protein DPMN_026914 [Dreissena polymorpha]|uniref:Uncharacterized protein n=1 Tax=Dreissena polymorpha TaxID=45954 RepID=A0A9D4RDY2_DREPO|nr:hypothetical protein DPMN_026914 [Dreissena polymorpha]